jgi:hypothetical protein
MIVGLGSLGVEVDCWSRYRGGLVEGRRSRYLDFGLGGSERMKGLAIDGRKLGSRRRRDTKCQRDQERDLQRE